MIEREVAVVNKRGFHLRAASRFVTLAQRFPCRVWVRRGDKEANGKSVMGLLKLGAVCGSRVVVGADGPEEAAALAALVALVEDRFGEDE